MGPTAGSAVFLDTNILVFASFSGTLFHAAACSRLSELENIGTVLWTSRQVLREFLTVTTRPGTILPPPSPAVLSQAVRRFEAVFQIADEDAAVTSLLLELLKSRVMQGKQIHDGNIVATMLRNRITWLLTHNVADFSRYAQEISILTIAP